MSIENNSIWCNLKEGHIEQYRKLWSFFLIFELISFFILLLMDFYLEVQSLQPN